jgi:DNA gyrase/topoisomerase IV subunit A
LKDIPSLGRTTQGVRIMRLAENDSVASISTWFLKNSLIEAEATD